MNFSRATRQMAKGKRIRRPDWKPGVYLFQTEWQGIKVAVMVEEGRQNEFYNFPLADVLTFDWEEVDGQPS